MSGPAAVGAGRHPRMHAMGQARFRPIGPVQADRTWLSTGSVAKADSRRESIQSTSIAASGGAFVTNRTTHNRQENRS